MLTAIAGSGAYRVVFLGVVQPPGWPALGVLGSALVAAVLLEVAGAARHVRSRLAAWFGLAIVFALFFPSHAALQNLFGSVFGSFIVALFFGGGGGLFFGEFAVRRARS